MDGKENPSPGNGTSSQLASSPQLLSLLEQLHKVQILLAAIVISAALIIFAVLSVNRHISVTLANPTDMGTSGDSFNVEVDGGRQPINVDVKK